MLLDINAYVGHWPFKQLQFNTCEKLLERMNRFGVDISVVAEGMEMMGAASVLYPQLRLEDVVLANTVVLLMGFFASLSPAWRASRFQPIEAITKVN